MALLRDRSLLFFLALVVSLVPQAAFAEGFIEGYIGGAFTQKADLETQAGGGTATARDLRVDNSFTGGIRGGAWLPTVPFLGFAIDVFAFSTDYPPQSTLICTSTCSPFTSTAKSEQTHLAVALDMLFRLQLSKSDAFPDGQFQPYWTIGPALFFSRYEEPGIDARTTTVGLKGGAGARLMLAKNIGIFGEYRLTYFDPEFDANIVGVASTLSNALITHHVVAGLTIQLY